MCYIFNNLVATSANILISIEESMTSNKNADWIPSMRTKNIVLQECGLFYNEIRKLGSSVTTSEFVKFFLQYKEANSRKKQSRTRCIISVAERKIKNYVSKI